MDKNTNGVPPGDSIKDKVLKDMQSQIDDLAARLERLERLTGYYSEGDETLDSSEETSP